MAGYQLPELPEVEIFNAMMRSPAFLDSGMDVYPALAAHRQGQLHMQSYMNLIDKWLKIAQGIDPEANEELLPETRELFSSLPGGPEFDNLSAPEFRLGVSVLLDTMRDTMPQILGVTEAVLIAEVHRMISAGIPNIPNPFMHQPNLRRVLEMNFETLRVAMQSYPPGMTPDQIVQEWQGVHARVTQIQADLYGLLARMGDHDGRRRAAIDAMLDQEVYAITRAGFVSPPEIAGKIMHVLKRELYPKMTSLIPENHRAIICGNIGSMERELLPASHEEPVLDMYDDIERPFTDEAFQTLVDFMIAYESLNPEGKDQLVHTLHRITHLKHEMPLGRGALEAALHTLAPEAGLDEPVAPPPGASGGALAAVFMQHHGEQPPAPGDDQANHFEV